MSRATSNVVSPDAVLVSAIRSGDEQAMAQLYERYSAIVYSVALRVLGDTGAAEDILQEVFMQLWRSYASNPTWFAVLNGAAHSKQFEVLLEACLLPNVPRWKWLSSKGSPIARSLKKPANPLEP